MPSNVWDLAIVKFIPVSAVTITSETTIWTPGTGLRFRLLGYNLVSTTAVGNIIIKDNTAGATLITLPMPAVAVPTGDVRIGGPGSLGVVSGAINRVLTFTGAATQVVNGYIYGIEE